MSRMLTDPKVPRIWREKPLRPLRRPPSTTTCCPCRHECEIRQQIEERIRDLVILYRPRSPFERARLYRQAEAELRGEAA